MNPSTKSLLQALARGAGWLLLAIAGVAFWMGGRLIASFTNTPRGLAEIEGIGIAIVCGIPGALLKFSGGDETDEIKGPTDDW